MNINDLFERIPMPIKPRMPSLDGASEWLNSAPLTTDDLRGKVVAVDFWTYTCINWLRTLPYRRAWAEAYSPHGLVVVGVHTPEFSFEHDVGNVRRAALDLGVEHPIAIDNEYAVWNAFANQYWPALYIADAHGRIRHQHFGEGGYERAERVIRNLLEDAGAVDLPQSNAVVAVRDVERSADPSTLRSSETYVGHSRAFGFANSTSAIGVAHLYVSPPWLRNNEWALHGTWTLSGDRAVLDEGPGSISYRFHARDVNVILSPPSDGPPVRFRVRLDGQSPGDSHGLDVDSHGNGVIDQPRMYQLIRQSGAIDDRLFEIELLDAGAAAFCFTFG